MSKTVYVEFEGISEDGLYVVPLSATDTNVSGTLYIEINLANGIAIDDSDLPEVVL